MDEKRTIIEITVYDAKGAFYSGMLGFMAGVVLASALPLLLGSGQHVFVLAGILFFAVPILYFPFIKKRRLKRELLLLEADRFSVQENSGKPDMVVLLEDLSNFKISPFRNMIGNGFSLRLQYKDGRKVRLSILDKRQQRLDKDIRQDSVLYRFCSYINAYNRRQSDYECRINPIPSFFASPSGVYLLWLPAALLLLDLFLRVSGMLAGRKDWVLFFLLILYTINMIAFRSRDKQIFERISEMQDQRQ